MPDTWPISAFGDEIATDLEDQVEELRRNEVGAIELRTSWGVNVVELDDDELDRAHRLLETCHIAVSAVASPLGKVPVDGDFDSELARLRAAMRAAKRLETDKIRVFSFFIPDGRYAECRDEVLRRMSTFAAEAESEDLMLVHENESYIYGDTPERCRDLVESIGSRALKVAFDPANFVQVGVRPFDEGWPLLASHVTHFHVKDAVAIDRVELGPYPARAPELMLMASVRPAGEGDGQLEPLLRALKKQSYHGFLVVEPHLHLRFQDMTPPQRFGVAVAALRKLLAQVSPEG
jgi:sugar phosphate isomerase/epimerase